MMLLIDMDSIIKRAVDYGSLMRKDVGWILLAQMNGWHARVKSTKGTIQWRFLQRNDFLIHIAG